MGSMRVGGYIGLHNIHAQGSHKRDRKRADAIQALTGVQGSAVGMASRAGFTSWWVCVWHEFFV
ncbi:MAG: hypothetical protein AAFR81_28065 [Chloroflexota bacterium]